MKKEDPNHRCAIEVRHQGKCVALIDDYYAKILDAPVTIENGDVIDVRLPGLAVERVKRGDRVLFELHDSAAK